MKKKPPRRRSERANDTEKDIAAPSCTRGRGEIVRDADDDHASPAKINGRQKRSRLASGKLTPSAVVRGKYKRAVGDYIRYADHEPASGSANNGHASAGMTPSEGLHGLVHDGNGAASYDSDAAVAVPVANHEAGGDIGHDSDEKIATCLVIQNLHRDRQFLIKSRNRQANAMAMYIMVELGYDPTNKAARDGFRKKADRLIKLVVKEKFDKIPQDQVDVARRYAVLIVRMHAASNPLLALEKELDAELRRLASTLPVSKWIEGVRGIGIGMLAIVVGEAGNLGKYAGPYKLFKRLGLAPYKGKMPATHRSQKSADKLDWIAMKYSPRRRAAIHQIGLNIVMQNDGKYRAKFDEAKERAATAHPDWSDKHVDNHARLLALKLFIKDLWKEWTGK